MSVPASLLAKSRIPGRPPLSLEQHLLDTERAAQALFDPGQRLHRSWLRFFRLRADAGRRFLMHARVAALFHDLGKANADFYAAVAGGDPTQLLRHEHISGLLLFEPQLRSWLQGATELDLDVVTAAVLSHHLKVHESPQHDFGWCRPRGTRSHVALFLDHAEVRRTLDRIAGVLDLGPPPSLSSSTWSASSPWAERWVAGMRAATLFRRNIRREPFRRGLLLATKAAVIAADSVASALVREARPFDWIDSTIHRPSLTADEIEEDILRPRADQLSRARGKTFRFHRFQELSAEQGPRALLLAACGAGKTLAAWRWAAAQARTRPFGRVVFMYPTRGTATEGFRDYVGWAPEGDAALVHGTARYELETMLSNPPESLAGKDPRIADEDARLFALAFWSPRYFSATVDQFLGFLEHQYASMCLLPVLADSAVVIDEVHSFDRRMFDDLVAFLTAFDVPVLCMTATLGASRRAELERRGLDVFPREEHRAELADLDEQERHSRYRIEMSAPEFPALLDRVVCAAWEGLRVLWVVNTVARCQRAAVAVQMALGRTPLVYHSRFRLRDRRVKHESVVSAFQRTEATVAITTQVCEMSLDLDADLLLTEVAPVSSLVQRFGRANRHRARGDAFLATLIVYPPESAIPYATDDIRRGTEFSTAMVGVTSQRALADALERWATPEPAAEGSARFLESGYFATPGPFRDTDEYAGPCVLDADLPELQERLRVRRPWDDLVINVPQRAHLPERPDWLPRHLRVAPNRAYDIHLGFVVS